MLALGASSAVRATPVRFSIQIPNQNASCEQIRSDLLAAETYTIHLGILVTGNSIVKSTLTTRADGHLILDGEAHVTSTQVPKARCRNRR